MPTASLVAYDSAHTVKIVLTEAIERAADDPQHVRPVLAQQHGERQLHDALGRRPAGRRPGSPPACGG